MRSEISLEIYGTISDPSVFNSIVEAALDLDDEARLAAADAGDGIYDDLIAVARYIEGVAASNGILRLAHTRLDFSELRALMRSGDVGYRYMEAGEFDMSYTEVTSFLPDLGLEMSHEVAGVDSPVFSFADVERADQHPRGIRMLLERARIACFLPQGARIELADGLVERWMGEFASDADGDFSADTGATTWER